MEKRLLNGCTAAVLVVVKTKLTKTKITKTKNTSKTNPS